MRAETGETCKPFSPSAAEKLTRMRGGAPGSRNGKGQGAACLGGWTLPNIGTSICGAMIKNTSFSLGEHFTKFIGEQVDQGRYGSASDVIRAGLRLLEEQEAHLAALREALIAGERSGTPKPFDFDKFIARKRKEGATTAKSSGR